MRKALVIYLFLIFYFFNSFASAGSLEDSSMVTELCQAQSLANSKVGIYAIPEKILNDYFSLAARNNPKVKEAMITILQDNKLITTIAVEEIGVVRLTCTVKNFHYDKDNAFLELHIDKKELVGQPIASWFFNNMSLGFLTSIYGSPMNGIESKISGNSLGIDLKPFAVGLFKSGIGQSVFNELVISKVTTDNGIIYLHTNLAVSILASEK